MAEDEAKTSTEAKPDADTTTDADLKAELEKWKAMSRKHEQQAKDNADAAKRLAELDDSTKSEIERANERAAAADKRASEAESRALRLEVASDKGLTAAQARRLVGSTLEELQADADDLLASFKPADTDGDADTATGRPKEALRSGASPDGTENEQDLKDVLAAIPRA